jgi:hypothetical protein
MQPQLRTMQPSGGSGWRAGAGWCGFTPSHNHPALFGAFATRTPGKSMLREFPLTSLGICACTPVPYFFITLLVNFFYVP